MEHTHYFHSRARALKIRFFLVGIGIFRDPKQLNPQQSQRRDNILLGAKIAMAGE
jgi:hypothetical protein